MTRSSIIGAASLLVLLLTFLTVREMTPEDPARRYLESALDTIQTHSMNRDSVDWTSLHEEVLRRGKEAQKPADTYPAIRYALDEVNEHSVLLGATRAAHWSENENPHKVGPPPRGQLLEGSFGYLRVPPVSTGNESIVTARADSLQATIAGVDRQDPCGWIVDLRGNTGGNMWPMLAGVGPILGEGHVGTGVRTGQDNASWSYKDGKALEGGAVKAEVSGEPYRLSVSNPPVAVLAGDSTSSSGEAILISFRGRPNTRTFGTRTDGYSTVNKMFELSDGALLFLTVGPMADRTGRQYRGKITPHVTVDRSGSTVSLADDPVVEAATSWLAERSSCSRQSRK